MSLMPPALARRDQHASVVGILCLCVCLFGAAIYQQSPMRTDTSQVLVNEAGGMGKAMAEAEEEEEEVQKGYRSRGFGSGGGGDVAEGGGHTHAATNGAHSFDRELKPVVS